MLVTSRKSARNVKPDLVSLGVDVPLEMKERFDRWIDSVGMLKRRAVIAALELIQILPAEARDQLVRGDLASLRDRVRIQVGPAEGVDLTPEQLEEIGKALRPEPAKRAGRASGGAA